jgi:hypothetical protein
MIKAKCHCGTVELFFEELPDTYTICNCSICRRYAVKWIYFTSSEVSIKKKMPTTEYIWGDKMIAFHHCPTCGCVSHYTGVDDSELNRVAINANLLEHPQLLDKLTVRKFNGAGM